MHVENTFIEVSLCSLTNILPCDNLAALNECVSVVFQMDE